MRLLNRMLCTSGLMCATAIAVTAQPVNYTTTARFTSGSAGCNQTVALSTATCTNAAFSLLFTGVSGLNIGNGSVTSLGTFLLTGTGSQVVPPGVVTFELFINQTTPSIGAGSFSGMISGTVTTGANGNFSSLVWSPNQTRNIGNVMYTLIFDNVGPAAGRGLGIPINNERGINALVNVSSVVPEPATNALLATGVLMLVVFSRRRKSA